MIESIQLFTLMSNTSSYLHLAARVRCKDIKDVAGIMKAAGEYFHIPECFFSNSMPHAMGKHKNAQKVFKKF